MSDDTYEATSARLDAFFQELLSHADPTVPGGALIESAYVDGVQHVRVIYNAPVITANAGWFNVMPTNGTTTGNSTTTSGTPPSDPVCAGCEQPVPDTVWRAVLRAGPDVPADRWYHLRCAPAETEVLEPEPETD